MDRLDFPLNLIITQGDDRVFTFIFDVDGVPVDISTWEFWYTAKGSLDDADVDAVVALDPTDMTLSDSGLGTVDMLTMLITRTVSQAIEPGEYHNDLQVRRAGLIKTIGKGKLVVEPQVTIRTT